METQILHTQPLVNDSSLYFSVMRYDMCLKVQRTNWKVGQGWQVHHVQQQNKDTEYCAGNTC
jgi:hypothetical protein